MRGVVLAHGPDETTGEVDVGGRFEQQRDSVREPDDDPGSGWHVEIDLNEVDVGAKRRIGGNMWSGHARQRSQSAASA